jgi:hypothetical protein
VENSPDEESPELRRLTEAFRSREHENKFRELPGFEAILNLARSFTTLTAQGGTSRVLDSILSGMESTYRLHGITTVLQLPTAVPSTVAIEARAQAQLLKEVFGDPFRPLLFDRDWRTSLVVSLARSMYESRDFSTMTILGDALQDAGCEQAAILEHCNSAGPHVSGCWVVDLAQADCFDDEN